MKKLISYLYNRYCRIKLDTLFLNGIQRDFTKELNEGEQKERGNQAEALVKSLVFTHTINEQIQPWAEIAVNKCENSQQRNLASTAINIILALENAFKDLVPEREQEENFDKHNPL